MQFRSWWRLVWAIAFGIVASKILWIILELVATGILFAGYLFLGIGGSPI